MKVMQKLGRLDRQIEKTGLNDCPLCFSRDRKIGWRLNVIGITPFDDELELQVYGDEIREDLSMEQRERMTEEFRCRRCGMQAEPVILVRPRMEADNGNSQAAN